MRSSTRGEPASGGERAQLFAAGSLPIAFLVLMCQTSSMSADRRAGHDAIDESLLECFLELSLKERIQSAANFANAVETLRRIRSADDSEPAA